jgi:hypothetical protein
MLHFCFATFVIKLRCRIAILQHQDIAMGSSTQGAFASSIMRSCQTDCLGVQICQPAAPLAQAVVVNSSADLQRRDVP